MQDLRIRITADNRATGPLREVDRALANVGRSAASLGSLMQPLAAAFAGIGAGLGLQQIATSFAEAESRFLKLEQTVKATGNAAGLTAEELRTMARDLALSTLESVEGSERAVAQLLTFKAVGKDAFGTVLNLAADLSALGFGSLESNVVRLGKALENPVIGIQALREAGVSFTDAQRQMITSLVESGQRAQAMGLILEAVTNQVGGAAQAAAQGLAGKYDTLSQRALELSEALGKLAATPIGYLVDGWAEFARTLTEVANEATTTDVALTQMATDAAVAMPGFSAALAEAKAGLVAMNTELATLDQNIDSSLAALKTLGEALKTSYTGLGGDIDQGLKSMTAAIAARYAMERAEITATQQMAQARMIAESALMQAQVAEQTAAVQAAAAARISAAESYANAQKNVATGTLSDEKARANAIAGIDRALASTRIKIWDSLRESYAASLSGLVAEHERYKDSITGIEGQIKDIRVAAQEFFDEMTSGKGTLDENATAQDKYNQKLAEAEEAMKKARAAAAGGDTAEMEKYYQKAIELARQAATEIRAAGDTAGFWKDAGDGTFQFWDKANQAALLQKQYAGEWTTQLETINAKNKDISGSLDDQIAKLQEMIRVAAEGAAELSGLLVVKGQIQFEIDQDSLARELASLTDLQAKREILLEARIDISAALKELEELSKDTKSTHEVRDESIKAALNLIDKMEKNTSSTHTIYVKKVTQNAAGGLIGLADGGFPRRQGMISGAGTSTSDSIRAMLSRGEYVVRAAAVRHYGAGFLELLNRMMLPRLPRFATGGAVAMPAAPASSLAGLPEMSVNLSIQGAAPLRLLSSRDTARQLASALSSLQRGGA